LGSCAAMAGRGLGIISVTVLAVRTPVDMCPSPLPSAAAVFLPMRAASGVKNGAVADAC